MWDPFQTNAWNRIRYSLYSPFYDALIGFSRQRRRSIDLLELRAGERLLIVGAGTGLDLQFVPDGVHVTATDLTPAMLNRARERASAAGKTNVTCRVMDGQKLDFEPESFDAVLLHLILAIIPDPFACIRETARVLRPGGRVAVFDKFQRDVGNPSLLRRGINVATKIAVTDINRRLGPLVASAGLVEEHREPAWLEGIFIIACLRKPAGQQ